MGWSLNNEQRMAQKLRGTRLKPGTSYSLYSQITRDCRTNQAAKGWSIRADFGPITETMEVQRTAVWGISCSKTVCSETSWAGPLEPPPVPKELLWVNFVLCFIQLIDAGLTLWYYNVLWDWMADCPSVFAWFWLLIFNPLTCLNLLKISLDQSNLCFCGLLFV